MNNEQRHRNHALYLRLKDGDGTGNFRTNGLSGFVFEVPVTDCSYGGNPPHFTFRLSKDSECFRRLLRVISDHFDSRCVSDDKLEQLKAKSRDLIEELDSALDNNTPLANYQLERWISTLREILDEKIDPE